MFRRRKKDPVLSAGETLYFTVDAPAHALAEGLAECTDPHRRAALLEALGQVELAKAALHRPAFGPDPMEDEDGRDLADSTWWSGQMLLKLAEAEKAYANRRPRRKPRWRWQQGPLERAGGRWLDILANRRQDRPSSIALNELYWAIRPTIGGQAAEMISEFLYGPLPDLGTQDQPAVA
jgi:hypothetical protein